MVVWIVVCTVQSCKVCWFYQYCIGCCIIAGIIEFQSHKVWWSNQYVSGYCIIADIIAAGAVFHLRASDRQVTKHIWDDGLFARPVFY